jgi:hypothetical protein
MPLGNLSSSHTTGRQAFYRGCHNGVDEKFPWFFKCSASDLAGATPQDNKVFEIETNNTIGPLVYK